MVNPTLAGKGTTKKNKYSRLAPFGKVAEYFTAINLTVKVQISKY